MNKLQSRLPALLLVLILALALTLRLTGVNWDDDSRLHPDERFMTDVASRIGSADNLINEETRDTCISQELVYQYFNTTCSVYNPDNVVAGSFAYGTLPVFIVRGVAQFVVQLNPGGLEEPTMWLSYDYIHYVGRAVNAIADTLVVLLLYMIGTRSFTQWHGLIAAALYACAPLPIQLAHFWTVDPLSNLFLVLGLYAAVNVAKKGSYSAYALFGIALGCALASRINLAPMAALLPLAVLARLQSENRLLAWRSWFVSESIMLLGAFAIALLAFRIGQPYAFVGPTISNWSIDPNWLREIQEVGDMSRLASDGWPPSVQWFERIRYVYPWFQMMMWGMGLVAGVAATIALGAALISQVMRRRLLPHLAVLSLWVVGYFALTGNLHLMTLRYYLQLYPPLLLLAAWFIVSVGSLAKAPARRLIAPAVLVGATAIAGISFTTSIYTQPITRIEASNWMNNNLPPTIEFADGAGNQIPVNVQHESSNDLYMQTAFNQESYISDFFELTSERLVGIEIEFSDPRVTQIQLQLLQGSDEGQTVLAEFELETDADGRVELTANQIPPITEGSYGWHIQMDWNEQVFTQEGIETPAFRHFIPVMVLRSEGELIRRAIRFRSPYQSIPYINVDADNPVELLAEQPITVNEVTFAHILDEPGPITFSVEDEEYTANPVDSSADTNDWNNSLGVRQRYVLDRPMEISADTSISLESPDRLLFTATAIATEGDWDDSVPTRYCTYDTTIVLGIGLNRDCIDHNSYSRFHFTELQLNMAETDSEVKYRRMVDILSQADFLVISSNRFYDAQPRVLRRFSMSNEYFNRLFSGGLEYSLLNTFRRGSNFLGIEFPHEVLPTDNLPRWLNELESEEAFTVYDHPSVFVFQNMGFQRYMFPYPTENTAAPAAMLDLETLPPPTYQLAPEPQTDDDVVLALIIWTAGFAVFGWIAFPLIYTLFPSLPLRGFAIGRALSWLALSVIPWWLTSILGRFFWSRPGLWLLLILFLVINAVIAYRRRAELHTFLQENWKRLVFSELIFFVALGIGLLLRAVNPDLWQLTRGGEKPMDYAYLNAILRTSVFPPPNPWMAGFPINYYYFGFVIAALPIKVGGFPSEVGYNLVLATLYAVVFSTIFTLAYSMLPGIRRNLKAGLALVGAAFSMLAGNFGTLKLILAPELNMDAHRWYWYPTRILGESANHAGGAINEIPLFSFLFGDLHAHILGLLPTTLFLIGMWALYKQKQWWIAVLIGVTAGAIYMTNIWDVLVYAPLGAILLWLAIRNPIRFGLWGFLIGISALITIAPLHLSFGSAGGFELWDGERSLIEPFLLVWGIPIGIAALWMLSRVQRLFLSVRNRWSWVSVVLIIVVILLALPPITATTVLCIMMSVFALLLAWRDSAAVRWVHLGVALIFGVLLALEYIVVRGDVGRMNTVFKISFQLWLWAGLLIPLILYWTIQNRRFIVTGVMLALVAIGLLYPLYAIPARYEDSLSRQITLDGNRFFDALDLAEGSATEDIAIINYLRTNAEGFPVIAEWYQTEYNWNSRFSVQTGLPAIVGWGNHMRQQYGDTVSPEVDYRIAAMQSIYTSGDIETIRRIIDQYNVQYIIFGLLERTYASSDTLEQFTAMVDNGELEPVFTSGDSVVYRVLG